MSDAYPYITAWRRGEDKDENLYSDWTVVLTSSENADRIETYHVHRVHLRNSKYFNTLLTMSGRVREHEKSTSHISICDEKMKVFPFILDYLYGVFNVLELAELFERDFIVKRFGGVGTYVIALLSLGRYFDITKLIKDTEEYILNLVDNRSTFLNRLSGQGKGEAYSFMFSEATAYGETDMAEILLNACAMEHAYSNTHVRSMIMKGIPLTTKMKVLELSYEYLQKKLNNVIRNCDIGKDNDKLVKKHKRTWGGMLVAGAGVKAVNGIYSYTGCLNNAPMFSKSGTWNGKDEVFSIYYENNFLRISIRKRIGDDIDFYFTDEMSETEDTIDTATWYVEGDIGTECAPTVCKHDTF